MTTEHTTANGARVAVIVNELADRLRELAMIAGLHRHGMDYHHTARLIAAHYQPTLKAAALAQARLTAFQAVEAACLEVQLDWEDHSQIGFLEDRFEEVLAKVRESDAGGRAVLMYHRRLAEGAR